MHISNSFVTVIIPVFNDLDRLRLCLEALTKQTYPRTSYEVIVIDNGSDENPQKLSTEFKGIDLKFLFESKVGSYAARNLGIKHSRGDILAFTDSDCIPEKSWIEQGVKQLMGVEKCGVVAGKVSIFYQKQECLNTIELYEKICAFPQERYVREAKFGVTANLFTFKAIFQEVGFYNENLVSAGDKEWGARVHKAGYVVAYAKEAVVLHPARNSIKAIESKSLRVAYGLYQLSLIEKFNYGIIKFKFKQFIGVVRDINNTIKLVFEMLYTSEISNFSERLKIMFLAFYFRYLRIFESVRLELGLPPRVNR
jgi:cellulose synthase/poly-beta-1,6-N-acetylglucosamine synthase-like glycosyltransferase